MAAMVRLHEPPFDVADSLGGVAPICVGAKVYFKKTDERLVGRVRDEDGRGQHAGRAVGEKRFHFCTLFFER